MPTPRWMRSGWPGRGRFQVEERDVLERIVRRGGRRGRGRPSDPSSCPCCPWCPCVLVGRGRGGRGRRGHAARRDAQVERQRAARRLRRIERQDDRHPDAGSLRLQEIVLELDREIGGSRLARHRGVGDAHERLDFLLLRLGFRLGRRDPASDRPWPRGFCAAASVPHASARASTAAPNRVNPTTRGDSGIKDSLNPSIISPSERGVKRDPQPLFRCRPARGGPRN